ncbi:MAG: ABC transporter ATP-binding protein [Desulfobacter sp.]
MTSSPILSVENLVKAYNGVTAVDNISFSIAEGTCFGLLGPNGAGKTTTIEIMENILAPDAGRILYRGNKRTKQFNQDIGIQFQQTQLMGFLSVAETLKTFAAFYDCPLALEEVISLCQLDEIRDKMNDKISGGQRQRLLLGLALVNDPHLIFLDEPSTGLDPQARHNVWDIIRDVKSRGKTVVLTTHYMEEAEQLCDTIAIMDRGKIIETGSPRELIQKHCRDMDLPLQNLESVFLKLTGRHLKD